MVGNKGKILTYRLLSRCHRQSSVKKSPHEHLENHTFQKHQPNILISSAKADIFQQNPHKMKGYTVWDDCIDKNSPTFLPVTGTFTLTS